MSKTEELKAEVVEGAEELDARIVSMQQEVLRINQNAYDDGFHLIDRPFVPSDLGFTESVLENGKDITVARVYTKEGYNIARPIDSSIEWYTVLKPDGTKTNLLLPNLFYAIITLSAIGMNLSIEAYNRGDY
jgi:hypothetical protein